MRPSRLTLVVNNDVPCAEGGAGPAQIPTGRILDPYAMRVALPGMWSAYLRARFMKVEEVAAFFGVAFQTACNWWNGLGRPSADKLWLAWLSDRAGFEDHFGAGVPARRAA